MGKRRLGALIGAAVLTFAAVGAVSAAGGPPTYTITVTKTADPASVPADGGDVQFTVWVHNTGTGFFQVVNVTDPLAGCSIAYSSGDTNSDGDLSAGETWAYTCIVTGVAPDTENTVTVNACHDGSKSACNNGSHDATGSANVTVTLCESDCPTLAPPTAAPTPTQGLVNQTNVPTEAPTDSIVSGASGPTDAAWLLVIAFGVLLASVVVLRPAPSRRND
jgi:hypothetical protein